MTPLCSMSPPLTASLAKTRVKHLHSAAFVQAKRLHSSASVGNCAGSGDSSDSCVTRGNGVVVDDATSTPIASALLAPVIVINDNASVSPSGGEAKVSLGGSEGDSTEDKGKMKRPLPEGDVEVLDLCGDDDEVDISGKTVSELPLKKLKVVSGGRGRGWPDILSIVFR